MGTGVGLDMLLSDSGTPCRRIGIDGRPVWSNIAIILSPAAVRGLGQGSPCGGFYLGFSTVKLQIDSPGPLTSSESLII